MKETLVNHRKTKQTKQTIRKIVSNIHRKITRQLLLLPLLLIVVYFLPSNLFFFLSFLPFSSLVVSFYSQNKVSLPLAHLFLVFVTSVDALFLFGFVNVFVVCLQRVLILWEIFSVCLETLIIKLCIEE